MYASKQFLFDTVQPATPVVKNNHKYSLTFFWILTCPKVSEHCLFFDNLDKIVESDSLRRMHPDRVSVVGF